LTKNLEKRLAETLVLPTAETTSPDREGERPREPDCD
jgi:hypothetical protein